MNTYLDSRPSRGAITTLILSAVLWQGVSAALGSQSSLRRIATAFAASVNPSDDVTWHQEAVDSALREAEAHIERLDYFGAKWILEQALRSNPASAAFHARFGFNEVGTRRLADGSKRVSMQAASVPPHGSTGTLP